MSERAPLPETLSAPPRGRVLAFVPHPDDDVIGCGGTLAAHAAAGDPVHVVVVFDGRRGDVAGVFEPEEYVAKRRAEARAGGAHLGLTDYEFWDYPEGHEPAPAELLGAARRIAACIAEQRPAHVYAPWVGEQHVDHHVLGRGVRLGVALAGSAGFTGEAWGFEVWTPLVATRIVDVTALHERKLAALAEHASQEAEIEDFRGKALALSRQRAMYLGPGARHGEAFRPLGPPDAADAALLGADA